MKVGVLFPSRFEDPGEFLADARAMEAAGVDSVWLEERADGLDPLLSLAAIAAVTTDLRLGLIRTKPILPNSEEASRVETLRQLSRQRFIHIESPSPIAEEGRIGSPSPVSGEGRGGGVRWRRVEAHTDRDAWASTLQEAGDDVDGVIVPLNPRLLDILRHPEDAIDRSDLILAQG